MSTTNMSYETQTQAFSTWGDKLLQHADRLHEIQRDRRFSPITIQLGPTEACDSDCPFCSVQGRPQRERIPFDKIINGLAEFRRLGAKALELTGGGNPLLYRDGNIRISDIISDACDMGYKVGIITNSHDLPKHLDESLVDAISWIRVSLIKLDEGKTPADYRFGAFASKLAFSYIIYDGTTVASIEKIAALVALHPQTRFVRIAANCLNDDSLTIKSRWGGVVAALDTHSKWFIKEIGSNFHAHQGGCWVGALRPYWVHDGVYICTSHVLKHRTYHPTWKLCGHDEITATWNLMNERFARGEPPYPIDIPGECKHCYYAQNNRLLDTVINRLPDWEFA